jgi:RNA polymerase sigma-70 factor (ECF subfamily)
VIDEQGMFHIHTGLIGQRRAVGRMPPIIHDQRRALVFIPNGRNCRADMTHEPPTVSDLLLDFLPNLRRFAISLCRARDVADDLVQAACERALASEDSFVPGTRFDAWMFRILRNLWIDQLRRQRTAGPAEDISTRQDIPGDDGVRTVEAKSELGAVALAIDQLSDEQREVLILVCVEDLSYADAAELLDVPIGTVMSRLARARANLAGRIGIKPKAARSSAVKEKQNDER